MVPNRPLVFELPWVGKERIPNRIGFNQTSDLTATAGNEHWIFGTDPDRLLQAQLHLQGGAGAVSVGQAAGEVVLLEAMEAAAHASPEPDRVGSRSCHGPHGDAESQRLLADESE